MHFKACVSKGGGQVRVEKGFFRLHGQIKPSLHVKSAKAIIQSGIKEVIYLSDKYHDTYSVISSRKMLDAAGVKYRPIKPTKASIVLNFK